MSTKTEERSPRAVAALGKVETEAKNIAKLEKQIEQSKTRMGKAALSARKAGVPLKDISALAGYSIGWVQQALVAAGYTPRAYNTNGGSAE